MTSQITFERVAILAVALIAFAALIQAYRAHRVMASAIGKSVIDKMKGGIPE